MTYLQSIILGVIQGLTEFLPVSSDGHLVLAQEIFGLRPPNPVAFDVLLHAGTLVAVLGYFRDDLLKMTLALVGRGGADSAVRLRWIWLLGLGTLPVAIFGGLFEDWFASTFDSLWWAGGGLLVTGTMLATVHGRGAIGRDSAAFTVKDALLMGSSQIVALLPGVSRSGSTLFAALTTGIERTTAARFSFLLSIPAIAGALVLKHRELLTMADGQVPLPVLAAGPIAAAITGWFAIDVLMRAVRIGSLRGFAVYCWIVGLSALMWGVVNGIGS
ncbi:MAG: undecaprenyl-diphosphate phosphatase [Deltaproteobacteria bacterium]|nr:undecaprenyl-diphosphate phosphatase [Deltaproteobacteria bacterium]